MFDLATRQKLRIETSKGSLSVEQLWDLNITSLDTIARNLNKQIRKDSPSDDLSFLDETQAVDPKLALSFEVVKHIYLTKKNEAKESRDALAKKEHNQMILSLIKDKESEALKNKSIEELKKELLA